MRTLIVDNYDSFTYNLYQGVGEIDELPIVLRNDASLEEIEAHSPERIILSPGPGSPDRPSYVGVCTELVQNAKVPILGVCLGHQVIVHAFGGAIVRARQVMHGKSSTILHGGDPLFADLPRRFEAMRYHSLVAEEASLPSCLVITARTEDGVIMGVRHRERPIHGVQFHPESIGTPLGKRLLRTFLLGSRAE